jgi:type IV secretion system protein VirB5
MSRNTPAVVLAFLLAAMGFAQSAHAQFAVIDVNAIAQLAQEIREMQQAIEVAQSQLAQAQQQYQSMTGTRGMQNLLTGITQNDLPATWPQVSTGLSSSIQANVNSNAVLTSTQVSSLSPAEQQQVNGARWNAALLQAAAEQAYANASSRFASLQELINAIPSATDQKGILELQTAAEAENDMLRNDATKLMVLYQAAQAQQWAQKQAAREQVVAGVGNLRTLPALQLP